jgi:broad-specificity NMP kinase
LSNTAVYNVLKELEKRITELLKTKDRILVSVTGGPGSGKSHFGKLLRKRGMGRFSRRVIAVIDDNLLKLDFLFFFRRNVRIPCTGIDELKPFLSKLPGRKRIVFFMNATPEKRITEADIILRILTDEETRRERLRSRNRSDPEKLQRFLDYGDTGKVTIKHSYYLEAEM